MPAHKLPRCGVDVEIIAHLCLFCKDKIPSDAYINSTSLSESDFIGHRFGRLVVQHYAWSRRGTRYWCCLCDCGQRATVGSAKLTGGTTVSCKCYYRERFYGGHNATHRMSNTPIYRMWRAMIERCTCPSSAGFKWYGARGITVCARWQASFQDFFEDMGHPPPGKTLDRVDNNGPYSPENCAWATPIQQANNMRRNHLVTYNDVTHTIADWGRITGLSRFMILNRLRSGWPIKDALTISIGERQKYSRKERPHG